MRNAISALFIWVLAPAFCQTAHRPGPDLAGVYERLSSSDHVVIGKVIKSEGILNRLVLAQQLERSSSKGQFDIGGTFGGRLFTIAVEQHVCRKTDFLACGDEPVGLSSTVNFFVPVNPPDFDRNADPEARDYLDESPLIGERYLIFLKEHENRQELNRKYARVVTPSEIHPFEVDQAYYRAFERSRGLVLLPKPADEGTEKDEATPLLTKVKQLCEAVRPADVVLKQLQLERVKYSGDPVLTENADKALAALSKSVRDRKQK